MVSLGPDQIINLSISILLLIPTIFLYKQYKLNGIAEFLLFSFVFLFGTIASAASVLVPLTDWLIFYQINMSFLNFTFFLLFIHGLRVKYKQLPRPYLYIGLGYLVVLTVLILFWQPQQQPDEAVVLFLEMPYTTALNHPSGAGLQFGETIIYSSSFYIIGVLYWIFCIGVVIWAYQSVELANPTPDIRKAQRWWIVAWILDLVWTISLIPYLPQFEIVNLFILINNIIIIYLLAKYPQSMLISHNQISRYMELYTKIMSLQNEEEEEDFGMESLVSYMKSIPSDILEGEKV